MQASSVIDTAPLPPPGSRSIRLGKNTYPLVLPTIRDPRLHLAAVIVSLQILGQTALGFELSIAQILVSLVTVAVLELAITFKRQRMVIWPASAMLTGNGVAFILRVHGTRHGDWWSMNGWYYFAGIAAVSLLSKYLIRYRGRHIFNPSNLGLVLGFLILGTDRVNPLDFWWGPISPALTAAIAIIVIGGLVIVSRLKMLGMAMAFWVTFSVGIALLATTGHCMTARWRFGPVCGQSFWWVLVTSPEILVFLFFMITDPKTTPAGRVSRLLFGLAVGFEAVLFAAPQQTEFATKVAVLASLVVICAVRPYFEKFLPLPGSEQDRILPWLANLFGIKPKPVPGEAGIVDSGYAPTSWARVAGRGALAMVILNVAVFALLSAGAPARLPIQSFAAGAPVAVRPPVPIDPAGVPAITVHPEVQRINPEMNEALAKPMVLDLLADLAIEKDALQSGDTKLASTAIGGHRLRQLTNQIDEARRTGEVVASTYTFERIGLVLVYDLVNAQAGPQYGIEVHGTEHRVTYGGSPATRAISQVDIPIDRTYAMLFRDGHFLAVADYPPTPEPS